jgi:hypothetical protein
MQGLDELYSQLARLFQPSVAANLARLEFSFRRVDKASSEQLVALEHLNFGVLRSAVSFKRAAGQIRFQGAA